MNLLSSDPEYQFLLAIVDEANEENSPYQIMNCPSTGIDLFFLNDFTIPSFMSINPNHTIIDMGIKVRLLNVTKYNSYYYINISLILFLFKNIALIL